MGNTLTGLTPATTYDALIKVGDNSPVDGTLKQLSDGLGNDIPISVSTSSINLTGTATVGGVAIANTTQLAAKQDTLVSGTNIKTINSTSVLGSGNVLIDKTSIGLGNVVNVDTTNASNILSGTLNDSRLSSTVTKQGNTFNGASQLVQLDASAKLPAVDGSQLTNLPIPTQPNGLLKIASAMSSTLQTVSDYLNNLGVLQLSNRRVGVLQDTGVTTQTSSVIQATTTNANLVIAPNGTGALIADIPDGTIAGGNARGNNSVDLQMSRTNVNQVAVANNSFIGGGANNSVNIAYGANEGGVIVGGVGNTVGANYGFIGGGTGNSLSGNDNYQVIVGGSNNGIASSGGSFIGGGNANSINTFQGTGYCVISGGRSNSITSTYSTISGGQSNTASTGTHATVVGGQSNTSSGQHSVTGGTGSVASGIAAISLGQSCNATSNRSVAIGSFNTAGAESSIALGNYAQTTLWGQLALSSYFFAAKSDQQQSYLTAAKTASLNSAATTVLSLDGTGVTNLIIPSGNNRAWNVTIDTIAVVTTITGTATGVSVGDCYRETKQLLFKRIGGTSSIVGTVDTSAIKSDLGMATASITISAGGSQQMAITFTAPTFVGGGSVTCRVVSKVMLVEVAY
jgi:hypothetical protein